MKTSVSLTAAEHLVDIATVLIKSEDPRDLLPLLVFAQAVLIDACSPDPKAAELSADKAGPALAEAIRSVQQFRLAEAKPGGNA